MSVSLLLDFGATRIKSALVNEETGKLSCIESRGCTAPVNKQGRFEIPLKNLTADFLSICTNYAQRANFARVFVCSQMHGFVLADKDGRALTDYISWQDESVFLPCEGKESSWSLFSAQFGEPFKDITGMRLRAGFPAVKILDFVRRNPGGYIKVLSLPEALLLSGKPYHKAHITMAAGSGCVDFSSQEPSADMIRFFSRMGGGVEVSFNEICRDVVPAGEINVSGRWLTVYTGVGDHQCAVLGAGNNQDSLSFNIGTGSQVSAVCGRTPVTPDTERRHFFAGQELQTITHIPAGRVLAALTGFFKTLTGRDGWASFNAVSLEDIKNASLHFNLAFFPDAWGFNKEGGSVTGLTASGLTEKNFWASLFASFAVQYVKAARLFTPARKYAVLSGGKLAKNPVLAQFLQQQLQMPVKIADVSDETLIGLALLAKEIR